jgi:hypothetical protein
MSRQSLVMIQIMARILALPKSLKSGNFILAKATLWCMGKNPA